MTKLVSVTVLAVGAFLASQFGAQASLTTQAKQLQQEAKTPSQPVKIASSGGSSGCGGV